MDRRQFLTKSFALSVATLSFMNLKIPPLFSRIPASAADLALVKNSNPRELVRKAIEALGGISRFVKKGDVVVVKPNMGWARRPEQAANTNPDVVAEVVSLCRQAGAAKIKVFDYTCNEAKQCYHLSGIEEAAKKEGAKVSYIYRQKFKKVNIPGGTILKSWEFYKDALEADVYINVPIIKHHSLAKLTMGLKNIMGVIGGKRGRIHNHFSQKIVDLNTVIKPQLTILDAVRILLRNGPQGGNINDVKIMNTIIAGTDPVAVDALGATVFGMKPQELGYLQQAYKVGLGEIDPTKLKLATIDLQG